MSVALRKNLKLTSKYYGPYLITERIGLVTYKLGLLSTSKIHMIFHVSLLKKKVGNRVVVQSKLPYTNNDGQFFVKPMTILLRQMVIRNNEVVVRVLVQWSNLLPEDSMWEDYNFLRARFTCFDSHP